MTNARKRLLLGMFGVGSVVLASLLLNAFRVPAHWLPLSETWSQEDYIYLTLVIAILAMTLLPLDFLGGYVLPNRARQETIAFRSFLLRWLRGVAVQSFCFFISGVLILGFGRSMGLPGALVSVAGLAMFLVAFQLPLSRLTGSLGKKVELEQPDQHKISHAMRQTEAWGLKSRPLVYLRHRDAGFTGGIVGLPGREKIVLPEQAISRLSADELTFTIARRLEAIHDGSRNRGVACAFVWVLLGFSLSAILPGAGVTSVAALVTTCLGFTSWTFLGLLILPSLSRQASYAIDGRVMSHGAARQSFEKSVRMLDQMQDDEPERTRLIETVFHPVPSVQRRITQSGSSFPIAWHAARMTLFLSWACMGTLVRSVHCNVGRPELWVMLPTD